MAADEYKIRLRNGSTQAVKASQQNEEGTFLVFYDEHGEVYRAPAADIASVARADVAEPEVSIAIA